MIDENTCSSEISVLERLESRISGWEECIEIDKPNVANLIEAWEIIMGLYRLVREPMRESGKLTDEDEVELTDEIFTAFAGEWFGTVDQDENWNKASTALDAILKRYDIRRRGS